ncbi:hypothetical protein D6R99_07670 [Salmonella enterica subsp. enterica]|nr:hypothetical protein [Salmonella enterica subsp. enterica serovar Paratyphi B]
MKELISAPVAVNAVRDFLAGVEKVTTLDSAMLGVFGEFYGTVWSHYENPFDKDKLAGFNTQTIPALAPDVELKDIFNRVFNPDPEKDQNDIALTLTPGHIGGVSAFHLLVIVKPRYLSSFRYERVFIQKSAPEMFSFSVNELALPGVGQKFLEYVKGTANASELSVPVCLTLKRVTGYDWNPIDFVPAFVTEHTDETYFSSTERQLRSELRCAGQSVDVTVTPASVGRRSYCIVTITQENKQYRETFMSDNFPVDFAFLSGLRKSVPDSGDRSRNEPVYLMSAKATRSLLDGYKLDRSLDDIRHVAKQQGWSDVQAFGQQLLFIS